MLRGRRFKRFCLRSNGAALDSVTSGKSQGRVGLGSRADQAVRGGQAFPRVAAQRYELGLSSDSGKDTYMSHPADLAIDPNTLRNRRQRMTGRNPHETGRVASTLELLFDLTFVVAIATAASQFAHAISHGHAMLGLAAFLFSSFGIIWAWVNYSWFASAYDTDDWLYRLVTMAQVIGVLVFTLGIPQLFESVTSEHTINNSIIVIGYVIMRVAMLAQWLRAYKDDVEHRPAIRIYVATLVVAQILWIPTTQMHNTHLSLAACFAITTAVSAIELLGPIFAERGVGTPWHAHHICERHGLLTIISIGEVITGTALMLGGIIGNGKTMNIDWSDAVLVGVSGIGLAFGMWWTYFITPFAEVIHHFRSRSFGFGYAHFIIWPSIAAVGAGLHVVALTFERNDVHISHVLAASALAIPVGCYVFGLFLAHYLTTKFWAGLHTFNLLVSLAVLIGAVAFAYVHVPLAVVLAVITVVPWITVGLFELHDGAVHEAQVLEGLMRGEEAH